MDSTSFADRRSTPRIYLRAYGSGFTCQLLSPETGSLQLIDVSPNGARLKSQSQAFAPEPGQQISLSMEFRNLPADTSKIVAEVRWHDGQEFGVKFLSSLGVTVGELQRALDTV